MLKFEALTTMENIHIHTNIIFTPYAMGAGRILPFSPSRRRPANLNVLPTR